MSFHAVTRLLVLTLLTSTHFQALESLLAFRSKDLPSQSSGSASKNQELRAGIEVLTYTEGVDFNAYLRGLYLSVRDKWRASMPQSVLLGQQGINSVQFRVLQDGKVPEDSLRLVSSSEKKDLDEASLRAIRKAAPFGHLPEKFSQPFIELRMTFYYNVGPPK